MTEEANRVKQEQPTENGLAGKTVKVNPGILIPSEYNPRLANDKEYRDLVESIEKFGCVEPLIVNCAPERMNIVIGGHFRLKVCQDLRIPEIDVRYTNIPDLDSERELNLRLNKNLGRFDLEKLANFEEEMLMKAGWEPKELDMIFDLADEEEDPDRPEEVNTKEPPIAKLGDIYMLGDLHRLMCGDSTDPAQVKALMDGEQADMVFMDPPYNVNYHGIGKNTSEGIKNDNLSEDDFQAFISLAFTNTYEAMRPGAVYYICSGWTSYPLFDRQLRQEGFNRSGVIIWVKESAGLGQNDYRYQHEWIVVGKRKEQRVKGVNMLYGWKDGAHYFRDTRAETDVWEVPRKDKTRYIHPTEKPVWLVERAVMNSTTRYQAVLDLFAGSGSTVMACERLKRKCNAMEFDPKYVDAIISRWEHFTKLKAVKVSGPGQA